MFDQTNAKYPNKEPIQSPPVYLRRSSKLQQSTRCISSSHSFSAESLLSPLMAHGHTVPKATCAYTSNLQLHQRTILPITHGHDVIAKSSSTRPFNSHLVIPPPLQTVWGHRTVLLSCHAIRGNDGDSGQPHGFELP
ncbi:hypothetical protein EDB85DRAFT_1895227 [Lactarius pseudohatsudake]|nr:hypothetical protein EDB85DRAFT_1895227 [Lactarius pseudohatsudake]